MERMINEAEAFFSDEEIILAENLDLTIPSEMEEIDGEETKTEARIDAIEVETGADAVDGETSSEPSEAVVEDNTEAVVNVDLIDEIVPILPLNNQIWSQNSPNIEGGSEDSDQFGRALAVGDFDGDSYDDLAIGIPYEDIGNVTDAGAVQILYGSSLTGLTASGDQLWHQNSSGIIGASQEFDNFGSSLATGDFNNDGYDDLAIGIPGEDVGDDNAAGSIQILYGSADGLTAAGDQIFDQDDLSGSLSEVGDNFGGSLTSGDFDNDGYDDLAVGSPNEDWNGASSAGMVHAIYGSNTGLTSTGNDWFSQQNLANTPEDFDRFGYSLAAGDFDNDGDDDLAIGVPDEDIGEINSAGAIHVVNGTSNGLTTTNNQFWNQSSSGITGTAEAGDDFGRSLSAGDFNDDGYDDLAVGVPYEDLGSGTNLISNAGAVNLLYGTTDSLTGTDSQFWHQNSSGIEGVAQNGDYFGWSLTTGDFNDDDHDDLAVGVRLEDVGNVSNAGAVNIINGSSTRLTSLNDRLISQNTLDVADEFAEASDNFGYSLAAGNFNGGNYADLAVGVPFEDVDVFASTTNSGSVNVFYDV